MPFCSHGAVPGAARLQAQAQRQGALLVRVSLLLLQEWELPKDRHQLYFLSLIPAPCRYDAGFVYVCWSKA